MDNEKSIKLIVDSYDLPLKIKQKLLHIAIQRTETLFIDNFEQIYEYIANLVEKFRIPYQERSYVRGDNSFLGGSNTFFETIETEDLSLTKLIEGHKKKSTIPIEKALATLDGQLDEISLNFLHELARSQNREIHLDISSEQLILGKHTLQKRIDVLAKKYVKDGKLFMPKRPIIQVYFEPFSIKFGNRRYNNNPLAFFEANKNIYGGMSRSELSFFDNGLYLALRNHGQLNSVIPIWHGFDMAPGEEPTKRKYYQEKLKIFCELVCPDYYEGISPGTKKALGSDLVNCHELDIDELIFKARKFYLENPNGIDINQNQIPRIIGCMQSKINRDYKEKASAFIKQYVGFVIPVSSIIKVVFYESIISHVTKNKLKKTG